MTPSDNAPVVPQACLLRVRAEPEERFTAEVVGLPELRATAATREMAVQQVRDLLNSWLSSGELVVVTADAHGEMVRPSPRQFAGHAKDDPDFDQYLEEIRRYREQVDQQQCPDSSSTPTT